LAETAFTVPVNLTLGSGENDVKILLLSLVTASRVKIHQAQVDIYIG
jgi:hypothetical protein